MVVDALFYTSTHKLLTSIKLDIDAPNSCMQYVFAELNIENFKFVSCYSYNRTGYEPHCIVALQSVGMNFCYNNLSVPFIGYFNIPNSFLVGLILIIAKNLSMQLHCLRKKGGGGY